MRHFTDLATISAADLKQILKIAAHLKKNVSLDQQASYLRHKNLAMIFEKNSTRTRVSFEVAMNQLGGSAIIMRKDDTQIGKGETIADTAKVLSRYVDCIMIRSNSHQTLLELAQNATVPVINALSDYSHPCQIIASLLTIEEYLGEVACKKLVWFGDQNNVLNSYIHAALAFDFELVVSSPKSLNFSIPEIEKAQKNQARVSLEENPKIAAQNADVLITDTWISMGDAAEKNEEERLKKIAMLRDYAVSGELMKLAKPNAIFTHCLPAYRGFEVEAEVIDSKNSVVFDEAENRLHAQKAILLWLFEKEDQIF